MPIIIAGGGGAGVGVEVAYAEITSSASIAATSEATANTVVTAGAISADGSSAYLIEFFSPEFRPDFAAANRAIFVVLYQDGASIGEIGGHVGPAAVSDVKPCYCLRRLIPASGSRTYSIRAYVTAGTGNVGAGAGGNGAVAPAFIRITKAT